jgi:glycosyltransferase involved in cell wall biosynthesis
MKYRVLIILESGDVNPGCVVRGLLFRELFTAREITATYVTRLCPWMVRLVVYPPPALAPLMRVGIGKILSGIRWALAYIKESWLVIKAKRYDAVYTVHVRSLRLLKNLRQRTKARLVVDMVDALWLPRYQTANLHQMLQLADLVTTDNEFTASYVRSINPKCMVIPDCPQVEAFDAARPSAPRRQGDSLVLGWVGSHGTVYNLYVVWEALERLFARHPHLHLRLVGVGTTGNGLPPFEQVRFSCRPTYSQKEMIQEVLGMDIGLFPLQDVEASRVRGILKATVYMAGEAAVVASPVGQCASLIQDGTNGFLASTLKEWEDRLEQLISNPDLRRRMVQTGLEMVRSNFTLESSFAKLWATLHPGITQDVNQPSVAF